MNAPITFSIHPDCDLIRVMQGRGYMIYDYHWHAVEQDKTESINQRKTLRAAAIAIRKHIDKHPEFLVETLV